MVYQMMFAIITPALMTGAFAERMKFSTFLVFSLLWATLIYDPLAHWVWGVGGWLRTMGALDFAGGTVVHISSGISALVAVLIMGKRVGFGKVADAAAQPAVCGDWRLHAVGGLVRIQCRIRSRRQRPGGQRVCCHAYRGSSGGSWLDVRGVDDYRQTDNARRRFRRGGRPGRDHTGAGFVTPLSAIIIGLAAGVVCYTAVMLKSKFGYDDSLDVVGVHGVGGIFGAIATGVFASKAVNSAGADGLIYGNWALLSDAVDRGRGHHRYLRSSGRR